MVVAHILCQIICHSCDFLFDLQALGTRIRSTPSLIHIHIIFSLHTHIHTHKYSFTHILSYFHNHSLQFTTKIIHLQAHKVLHPDALWDCSSAISIFENYWKLWIIENILFFLAILACLYIKERFHQLRVHLLAHRNTHVVAKKTLLACWCNMRLAKAII